MTRLANLQHRVLRHAIDQLERLVAAPRHAGGADPGSVRRQEAVIARHARDFGWLARLHLETDATAYEISYAARRWFERPSRPAAQLRIRDLVGMPLTRLS
ncbi:MAG: hypothetical protein HY060_10995 [Proteobacteria bacterium]|nr:hypothetical protein [Pseudomonadota bacterium]